MQPKTSIQKAQCIKRLLHQLWTISTQFSVHSGIWDHWHKVWKWWIAYFDKCTNCVHSVKISTVVRSVWWRVMNNWDLRFLSPCFAYSLTALIVGKLQQSDQKWHLKWYQKLQIENIINTRYLENFPLPSPSPDLAVLCVASKLSI